MLEAASFVFALSLVLPLMMIGVGEIFTYIYLIKYLSDIY
jgi:hypothetical protein